MSADQPRQLKKPSFGSRVSTWLLSLIAIEVTPLFPVFVEGIKTGWAVRPETYLLTAAVLAAGFGFSSDNSLFQAFYLLLFLLSVGFDFQPEAAGAASDARGPATAALALGGWFLRDPSLYLMSAALGVQAVERLFWHVRDARRFPDWLK